MSVKSLLCEYHWDMHRSSATIQFDNRKIGEAIALMMPVIKVYLREFSIM